MRSIQSPGRSSHEVLGPEWLSSAEGVAATADDEGKSSWLTRSLGAAADVGLLSPPPVISERQDRARSKSLSHPAKTSLTRNLSAWENMSRRFDKSTAWASLPLHAASSLGALVKKLLGLLLARVAGEIPLRCGWSNSSSSSSKAALPALLARLYVILRRDLLGIFQAKC